MDKQILIEQLMGTFLIELEEHLRSLNRELLLLEKTPPGAERGALLTTLFRAAHSLKGAARAVDQDALEALCHELEAALAPLRDGSEEVSAECVSALFAGVDRIEHAAQSLKLESKLDVASKPAPASAENGAVALLRPVAEPLAKPRIADNPVRRGRADSEDSMMRVGAHKLDALLAWSGELLVARRRIADRISQPAKLRQLLRTCRSQARQLTCMAKPSRLPPATDGTRRVRGSAGDKQQELDRTLRQIEHELDQMTALMVSDSRALEQAAMPVEQEIRRIRMLPFAEACEGLARMARDLATLAVKQVELVIEGDEVELDRAIVEQLRDPLRHLVRNAVDHGIETPAQRIAVGKPPRAQIRIKAWLRGTQVEISVSDQGRGLDLDAIRTHAQSRGLPDCVDPAEMAQTIFLPGFSTARTVTSVSGRGVGLDVVKSQVESLQGSVNVSWIPGAGSTFVVNVPLTLTMLRALLLRAGGRTFAIASANVHKLIRLRAADFRSIGGREMVALGHDQAPITVASLSSVLGFSVSVARSETPLLAVIVAVGEIRIALIVDEFLAEQDIMIKGLGRRIRRVPIISGATLLPSGQVALVLNAGNVVRCILRLKTQNSVVAAFEQPAVERRKRLIVADDSVTTRGLEKSILEAAGYEVSVAPDGQTAWQMLQDHGADLLVSDVEMPNLDGFGLTATVRGSDHFRDLPVVLVTARESEADKTRGLQVGANAYLVKSGFDQGRLLETIAQLL
jgi:two-component system, chemotaxis family, sensor kinase CheA